MIIEGVRQWADVLRDPTHGVLAQLTTIAARGGLEAGDVLPTSLIVGDETDNSGVAQGRPAAQVLPTASSGPPLSARVFFESLSPVDPISRFLYEEAHLSLGVIFDVVNDAMPIGVTTLGYLVRGAMNATTWWLRDAPQVPWRKRNGIDFVQGVQLQAAAFAPTTRSAHNTYGVRLIVEVRDTLALAPS